MGHVLSLSFKSSHKDGVGKIQRTGLCLFPPGTSEDDGKKKKKTKPEEDEGQLLHECVLSDSISSSRSQVSGQLSLTRSMEGCLKHLG